MAQQPLTANGMTVYGFTAISADHSALKPATSSPKALSASDLASPSTPLCQRIEAYAFAHLSRDTFAHSQRVYMHGRAIAHECFPSWNLTPNSPLDEAWFCSAMLHDIGTTDEYIENTRLSYEFWAGICALYVLQTGVGEDQQEAKASRELAESVTEAIFRHQDVQEKGQISLVTMLIQLGTLLDNVGAGSQYVHKETLAAITKEWSRTGWSGCFKATVEKEKRLKPHAMVSRIEGFEDMIMNNKTMKEFE